MNRPTLCTLIERRVPLVVLAARLRDTHLREAAIADAIFGRRSMEEVITEQWVAEINGAVREWESLDEVP